MRIRYFWMLMAVVATLVVAACGGGGDAGGGTTNKPSNSISLLGVVDFPTPAAKAAAKSAAATVAETAIVIDVFDLAGKKIAGGIHPTYDNSASTRIYSYLVPNLPLGVDYVVKASRSGQTVKKLVDKVRTTKDVPGVNLNAVSTTALVVAEQKLMTALNLNSLKLGEEVATPAAGPDAASLSTQIGVLKPEVLEQNISALASALQNNNLASINSENLALANMYLIVNQLLKSGIDVQDFVSGSGSGAITVNLLTLSGGTATVETRTLTSSEAKADVQSAAQSYVPPVNSGSAVFLVGQATKFMEAQDIPNANINYEKALAVEPTNEAANLGAAITKGALLIQDPDVKAIIERWGAAAPTVNQVISASSPVGSPFGNISSVVGKATGALPLAKAAAAAPPVKPSRLALDAFAALKAKLPQQKAGKRSAKTLLSAPANAPTVTEMQAVIDNVLSPALQTLSQRLQAVQGTGYTFTVTKTMQGNPNGVDIVLNDGEFYALDAAINSVAALLKIATAYNLDVAGNDYNAFAPDPLATLNNANFLTLKNDGRTKMAAALALLKAARNKTELAYGVIKARTAGQGAFDITGVSDLSKADFEKFLSEAKIVLNGETVVTIGGKLVTINVAKFFTDPLDRSDLPTLGYDVPRDASLSAQYDKPVAGLSTAYEYYWNGTSWVYGPRQVPVECYIVAKSDLPDYTLNGILPGNSASNNVAGFNGVLPVLDGKLLTGAANEWYDNLSVDGGGIIGTSWEGTGTLVKRIDPATGVVTNLGTLHSNSGSLSSSFFTYNGALHCFASDYSYDPLTGIYQRVLKIYPVDRSTWTVGSVAIWSKNLGSGNYWYDTAAVSNGSDVYYTTTLWTGAGTQTTVYKLSGLSHQESAVFTSDSSIETLMFSNGYLYAAGDDRMLKINAADGSVAAAYFGTGLNSSSMVLTGGNFYSVDDGKLIKSAGAPAGGLAKFSALVGF